MLNITINGQDIKVDEGISVLTAAQDAGFTIPTLCYHKDLSAHGGCRLCIVEVEGARTPLTSCTLKVSEGMKVHTETESLIEDRKLILELLLQNYFDAGYETPDQENNELFYWARYYNMDIRKHLLSEARFNINSDPNPFIWVDRNKCILCTRCIRACAEVQGRFVWGLEDRGYASHIEAGSGTDLVTARCESCGACVAYCPTGALTYKTTINQTKADRVVSTTCTYCGVGCSLDLNIKDEKIVRTTSNPDAPVNGLHLCVKGRFGNDFIHHPDRLTSPMVREYLLNGTPRPNEEDRGPWVKVDWETALEITTDKLAAARDQFGGDSLAMLTSAKLTNEENYLANKLTRQVFGTNTIDHCARL